MPSYSEFFAGGGMARAGLGQEWSCLFANDIDAKKAAATRPIGARSTSLFVTCLAYRQRTCQDTLILHGHRFLAKTFLSRAQGWD